MKTKTPAQQWKEVKRAIDSAASRHQDGLNDVALGDVESDLELALQLIKQLWQTVPLT